MVGIIRAIINCGSVVQVFIDATEPACCFACLPSSTGQPFAADANMWFFGGASDACHVGDVVEFDITDWGGLASIAPACDHPCIGQYATQRQEVRVG